MGRGLLVSFTASMIFIVSFSSLCDADCLRTGSGESSDAYKMHDRSKGQTFIASDSDYTFDCCGVISGWKVKFVAEGYVRLQVWRRNIKKRTRTYELVGQNLFIVREVHVGMMVEVNIHPHRRISSAPGDVIGWQFVANELIPYRPHQSEVRGRGFWVRKVGLLSSGDSVELGSGGRLLHHRKYAISAKTVKNQNPFFLINGNIGKNLTLRINDTYIAGSLIYQVKVSDNDTYDEHSLVITMETSTAYFEFQESTRSIRLKAPIPKGSYHLKMSVTDQCRDTSHLIINVHVVGNDTDNSRDRIEQGEEEDERIDIIFAVGVAVSILIVICSAITFFIYVYCKWKKENQIHEGLREKARYGQRVVT